MSTWSGDGVDGAELGGDVTIAVVRVEDVEGLATELLAYCHDARSNLWRAVVQTGPTRHPVQDRSRTGGMDGRKMPGAWQWADRNRRTKTTDTDDRFRLLNGQYVGWSRDVITVRQPCNGNNKEQSKSKKGVMTPADGNP